MRMGIFWTQAAKWLCRKYHKMPVIPQDPSGRETGCECLLYRRLTMNLQIVLKFVGCICIFSSSLLLGNAMEKKLKQRYLFFREMTAALSCLEKEMIHYRLLLPQALEKASSCCRAGPEKLFAYASTHFSQNGGSFQKLWQDAIHQCVPPALFSEEELCLLSEISGALCSSDAVLQKTRFDAYRTQFEQLENDAKEIWKEKSTLYRKLSAAAGVFFILLLL